MLWHRKLHPVLEVRLHSTEKRRTSSSFILQAVLNPTHPSVWLALPAARAHYQLRFKWPPTRMFRSLFAGLLSSSLPPIQSGLSHSRCRTQHSLFFMHPTQLCFACQGTFLRSHSHGLTMSHATSLPTVINTGTLTTEHQLLTYLCLRSTCLWLRDPS